MDTSKESKHFASENEPMLSSKKCPTDSSSKQWEITVQQAFTEFSSLPEISSFHVRWRNRDFQKVCKTFRFSTPTQRSMKYESEY